MGNSKLSIQVVQVLLKENPEVGDPVGFKIYSYQNENYLTRVDFGDSNALTVVGNNFIFNEYTQTGMKTINFQAQSLSNPTASFQTSVHVNVTSAGSRLPMYSVELNFMQLTSTGIQVNVAATGGEPYVCVLFFGDSANSSQSSTGQNSTFNLKKSLQKF